MKINLNARVRVVLNDEGRKVLTEHWRQYGCSVPPVGSDGVYETELWALMNEFGPALFNGCTVPFETTEIEVLTC